MSLEDKLFDWQKELINNIKTKYYGLFLDCGLGKTVVGLSLAEKHKCNKILIITITIIALSKKLVLNSALGNKKSGHKDRPRFARLKSCKHPYS